MTSGSRQPKRKRGLCRYFNLYVYSLDCALGCLIDDLSMSLYSRAVLLSSATSLNVERLRQESSIAKILMRFFIYICLSSETKKRHQFGKRCLKNST